MALKAQDCLQPQLLSQHWPAITPGGVDSALRSQPATLPSPSLCCFRADTAAPLQSLTRTLVTGFGHLKTLNLIPSAEAPLRESGCGHRAQGLVICVLGGGSCHSTCSRLSPRNSPNTKSVSFFRHRNSPVSLCAFPDLPAHPPS